jgi:hypothetical protein
LGSWRGLLPFTLLSQHSDLSSVDLSQFFNTVCLTFDKGETVINLPALHKALVSTIGKMRICQARQNFRLVGVDRNWLLPCEMFTCKEFISIPLRSVNYAIFK